MEISVMKHLSRHTEVCRGRPGFFAKLLLKRGPHVRPPFQCFAKRSRKNTQTASLCLSKRGRMCYNILACAGAGPRCKEQKRQGFHGTGTFRALSGAAKTIYRGAVRQIEPRAARGGVLHRGAAAHSGGRGQRQNHRACKPHCQPGALRRGVSLCACARGAYRRACGRAGAAGAGGRRAQRGAGAHAGAAARLAVPASLPSPLPTRRRAS